MTRRERYEELDGKLNALISEYADILGPGRCAYCDDDVEGCTHTPEEARVPVADVMFQDYLLIHRWSRMDRNGGYWDWLASESLLLAESVGILQLV